MGMLDDAMKNAVPGGNFTKPLVIAAGALILSKMLGGGKLSAAPAATPAAAQPIPTSAGGTSDGGLLGGLGSLIDKFRNGGHADTVNSWIGTGPNKPIAPGQLQQTLGNATLSNLAQQAGISEQDLLAQLSQALPAIIDKLTPNGRMPTPAEVSGYGR